MSSIATPKQSVNADGQKGPTTATMKANIRKISNKSHEVPVDKNEDNNDGGDDVVVVVNEEVNALSEVLSNDADEKENGMEVDDDSVEDAEADGAGATVEFSNEEVEQAFDKVLSDDADEELDEELDEDEVSGFSFFQLIFGKFVMIAIGLMMAIGDLANVEEDSETGIDEMYGLALKYLFGDLTDEEKLEIDLREVDIGGFTAIELETMQKAGICSNDNWTEIIKAENFLKILQSKFTGLPDHMQVFLKMVERVKACAEAFANAKDNSSTPTLKDYFHNKATNDKEVEARLNKSLLAYLKKQAEDTELCVMKEMRAAKVSDSIFTVVANMFITNLKNFNSMDLLGSNSRKALTELLSDVTEQKVKSKHGAIFQGLKHWRKQGKGVLSAAKALLETMTEEQQDIVIKKIKDATDLKTIKSYLTKAKDHYSENGKGKLMATSSLFTICPNTESLIMSSEAKKERGKNAAFLALPDDGLVVEADVLKVLQKHHKHQLKAKPEVQLAYMQSVLQLFEKFNCSSAQLTDPILKLFKEAMDQLQGCAENGRANAAARRNAKKRSRRDGDSDSESVDSNMTATTTGTPDGTPERKKQKPNNGD